MNVVLDKKQAWRHFLSLSVAATTVKSVTTGHFYLRLFSLDD